MAGTPALLTDSRCAALAQIGRQHGQRMPSRGRLIHWLALSLLLHLGFLTFLAWPAGPGAGDEAYSTARGAWLTAMLAERRTGAERSDRQASEARPVTLRNTARQVVPTPSRPAAKVEKSENTASPTAQSLAESTTNLPRAPTMPTLAPVTATLYYPADQLSVRPRALAEPLLDPDPLATIVASGEIAMTLWIDERGQVAELYVERSELPEVFVQTAAEAFRALRFAPGEIDGNPVGSVLHIAVRYDDERLAGERDAAQQSAVEPTT